MTPPISDLLGLDTCQVSFERAIVATFLGTLVAATPGYAFEAQSTVRLIPASIIEDIGAAERIAAADRLRVLSQEIAALACLSFSQVAPTDSVALVAKTRGRFRYYFDALYHGNLSLNIIGPETRPAIVTQLDGIDRLWREMSTGLALLADDAEDEAAHYLIKDNALALYSATELLVSDMVGVYSNPAELLQADALMIDIAGRQAMLTQVIANNACKIWSDDADQDLARTDLNDAMVLFEKTLVSMRDGLPDIGLRPAPTPEIAATLDDVIEDWGETRHKLDLLMEDTPPSDDAQAEIFRRMNDKTNRLEEVIEHYTKFAKHKY